MSDLLLLLQVYKKHSLKKKTFKDLNDDCVNYLLMLVRDSISFTQEDKINVSLTCKKFSQLVNLKELKYNNAFHDLHTSFIRKCGKSRLLKNISISIIDGLLDEEECMDYVACVFCNVRYLYMFEIHIDSFDFNCRFINIFRWKGIFESSRLLSLEIKIKYTKINIEVFFDVIFKWKKIKTLRLHFARAELFDDFFHNYSWHFRHYCLFYSYQEYRRVNYLHLRDEKDGFFGLQYCKNVITEINLESQIFNLHHLNSLRTILCNNEAAKLNFF